MLDDSGELKKRFMEPLLGFGPAPLWNKESICVWVVGGGGGGEQIYHPLALHSPTDSENALYNILSKESKGVSPCHLFLHLQTDKPQGSAHGLLP